MPHSSSTIRMQVESALSARIPAALTPQARMVRPQIPTGIQELDDLLGGGFPMGAVTELVGAECTGRTSLVLSFISQVTQTNKVCAWVDTSNALDPISTVAAGVDLRRLLWVRCGEPETTCKGAAIKFSLPQKHLIAPPLKKGLHGGGFGPHPRMEVRGMSEAMSDLFTHTSPRAEVKPPSFSPEASGRKEHNCKMAERPFRTRHRAKHYDAIERALRSADLLLQTSGFSAIVLDLASIAPEYVTRIELSTWHRYRVAAEKTQSCIVLLTQYPCTKSGSELQLRLMPPSLITAEATVFCGMEQHIEVCRQRFQQTESNVIPMQKPAPSVKTTSWQNRTAWAGPR